jgi:hypothetical protein
VSRQAKPTGWERNPNVPSDFQQDRKVSGACVLLTERRNPWSDADSGYRWQILGPPEGADVNGMNARRPVLEGGRAADPKQARKDAITAFKRWTPLCK